MNPASESAQPSSDFRAEEKSGKRTAILAGVIAAVSVAGAAVTLNPIFLGVPAALICLAGALFFVRHPSLLLWSLILTAPLTDHLGINVGGVNVRPYGPLTLLGVLWIVWQFLSHRRTAMTDIVIYYRGTLLILGLFIASKLLTIYSVSVMPRGLVKAFMLKHVAFVSLQMMAAFVCAAFIDSMERLQQILRAWLHVANVVFVVAVIQIAISNLTSNNYVWDKDLSPLGRAYSVFREPDVHGAFLASFLVMTFPLLVSKAKFVNRTYLILTMLASTSMYLLVVVRAAWLAGLACVFFYLVLLVAAGRFRQIMPYLNGALAAFAIAVGGLALLAPKAVEKIAERMSLVAKAEKDSASAYRMMELHYQSEMAFNPKFSTGGQIPVALGFGDYSWTYWGPAIIPPEEFDQSPTPPISDGFCMALSMFFDNGIVGLTLGCVFYLAITFNFLNAVRRTRESVHQALICGTYFSFLAVMICNQISYDPLYLTVWICLGFHLAAVYHVDRAERRERLPDLLSAGRSA